MSDLLDIIEMHESKEEPYDPAADGFVFSKTEIKAAAKARYREDLALDAWSFKYED